MCREHGAPIVSRGGGTSLAGQCTNTAVMIDWAKYCNRLVSVDVERKTCVVEPGIVLDVLNEQLEQARAAVRPGAGDAPQLHARRHDRQQLLRRHRAAHRQGRRQHRPARGAALRRHPVLVRPDDRRRVRPRSRRAATGRRGSTGSCARCATRYADEIRARFPDIPRRVSGYNLDSLLPEHGLRRRRAARRQRVDAGHRAAGRARSSSRSSRNARSSCSASTRSRRPPTPCPRSCRTSRSRSRGSTTGSSTTSRSRDSTPTRSSELPDGNGYLMVQFGGDTQHEADERAHRDDRGDRRLRARARRRDPDRPAARGRAVAGPRGRVSAPPRTCPNEPDTWEGWEDSAVAPGPARRLPARPGEAVRGVRLRRRLGAVAVRPLRPGLRAHPHPVRAHRRPTGVAKYRRFMERAADLVASYGGSLSGEHGDGQSRGELLPRMFGDTIMQRVRRAQGDLRPGRPDEPGQGRRAGPARRAPATRRRLGAAHRRGRAALRLPRGRRLVRQGGDALRRRRQVPAALARGRRGDVPVVPGHAGGGALHARPGPAAVRDAARAPGLTDQGRLALHRGARRARPVPGVQGLQVRLPGRRRHGDVQGRVPRPPLRRAGCARARTTRWAGCRCSPPRCTQARLAPGGQRAQLRRRCCPTLATRAAGLENREIPLFAGETLQQWWQRRGGSRPGPARDGAAVAGHLHQPLPPAHRPGRGRPARGRRAGRSTSPPNRCAAG